MKNTYTFLLLLFLLPFQIYAQEKDERQFYPDSIDAKYNILYNYDSSDDILAFKDSIEIEEIFMRAYGWDSPLRVNDPASYSISITKNGKVKLIGENNLKLLGKYKSNISAEMFVRLCYYIEKINFESIQFIKGGISLHSDSHKFIVKYKDGSKKEVTRYDNLEPLYLWSLAIILDNLRFSLEWEKLN